MVFDIIPTPELTTAEAQLKAHPTDPMILRMWQATYLQCLHAAKLFARRLCCLCTAPGNYHLFPATHMVTLKNTRGIVSQRLLCDVHYKVQAKKWKAEAKKGGLEIVAEQAVDPAKDISLKP